jgi:hypothetical protein
LDDFVQQFRHRFGREMTPEETRFCELSEILLKDPPEKDAAKKGDKAA